MAFTNSQLALKMAQLIEYWQGFNKEYADWLGGGVSGGPNLDGRYPLTDWHGVTYLVKSPAQLQADVDNTVAGAAAYSAQAGSHAIATQESAGVATTQAALAEAARIAAEQARTDTQLARDESVDAKVTAIAQANIAVSKAGEAVDAADVSTTARDEAVEAKDLAEAAAVAAQTFDPSNYAPVSHPHTWSEITGKPSVFSPDVHQHDAGDVVSGIFSVERIPDLSGLYLPVGGRAADAAALNGLDPSLFVRGDNSTKTTRIMDWSAVTASGFYDADETAAGAPISAWHWGIHVEHTNANGYGWQLLGEVGSTPVLKVRTKEAHTWSAWSELYHEAHKPTPSEIGAADFNHTHSYLPLSGGTLTGDLALTMLRTSNGQGLWINAGESNGHVNSANTGNGEHVYFGAESGLRVYSSPDNWGSGFGGAHVTEIGRTDGSSVIPGSLTIAGGTLLTNPSERRLRVQSSHGYFDLGAANGSYCHMFTDRPQFYMNKNLRVDGDIYEGASYNQKTFRHASSSYTSGNITFSTGSPSGGANGDIWFKYS